MRKFQATDASINRVIGAVRRESTTKIVGGEVISVTPERRIARVYIRGSASVSTCALSEGLNIGVGDDVLVAFIRGETRPVVISATGTLQTYLAGSAPGTDVSDKPLEPSSVSCTALFRAAFLEWWAPERVGQFFIVEANSTGLDDGTGVVVLVTHGSYYLYTGNTYTHFRVAAAMESSGTLVHSGWSSWVQGSTMEIVVDTSSGIVLHDDGRVLLVEVDLD